MVETYSIEQFPKNKDLQNLSTEQAFIRTRKSYEYGDKKVCSKCRKEQLIQEFYIADKETGRRKKSCRDCQMKAADVIEIGRHRFAKKILKKGFRRCSICKTIKHISSFTKNKNRFGGYSHNCYECQHILTHDFQIKQKEEIGVFYVKQYAIANYGIRELSEQDIELYRNEIIEKRKPKYFIDGLEFVTVADFAKYVEVKYGHPTTMTERRVYDGKTEEECKLSEIEIRKKYSGTIKGRIEVTDTVTGEVFEFNNTKDEGLTKMFSDSAITKAIKTGEKTRITTLSKYKNPCIIKRVSK